MSQGLLRHPAARFAILLLAALALRWDTFGDPNMHGDEVFYFTVGEAMHHGALPYVDVWDRKPFGLFAIYWLIAGISSAPLAYQLAACLFAAGTALAIGGIARRWTTPLGGLLAGLCYLLWLKPLQGFGGQAPIFYNLFIACAALLVLRALPTLRAGQAPKGVAAAMLLGGLAIAVKTSALFEAAFFGLYAAAALLRSPLPRARALAVIAGWVLLGALPSLIIAAAYAIGGHWAEFWHAMVSSNLAKQTTWEWVRLVMLFLFLSPVLLLATFGLLERKDSRGFLALWFVAAMAGLCVIPNFYLHYGLPLLVPLCVAAAGFLSQRIVGLVATAAVAALALWIAPFQIGHARRSAEAIAALEHAVRTHIGQKGSLLLYDAPPQLYRRTGQPFITPLVFPTHLSHGIEKDVSHLSTLGETKRVLALKPGAVVMAVPPRNGPVNEETHKLVLAYVGRNCRLVAVVSTLEWQRTDMIAVWGDCRK